MKQTCGILEIFDRDQLVEDLIIWSSAGYPDGESLQSAVYYLVFAIGGHALEDSPIDAKLFFHKGRQIALTGLAENLSIATVQAFLLVTMYMTCACERNGAFIYSRTLVDSSRGFHVADLLALAVRAAYSLGLHRTQVNVAFGPVEHSLR